MRSVAEPTTAANGRFSDPLDQVDYRLAQTPEELEVNLPASLPGLSA